MTEKATIVRAELLGSKKQKLSFKQKKFCEEVVSTMNPTEAAKRAYNLGSKGGSKTKEQIESTASVIAYENLRKLPIKTTIQELMEKAGFSNLELLIVHKELLESDDDRIRLSALDLGYKIKDLFPSQKIQIGKLDEIGDILTETDVERFKDAEKVDIIEVKDKEKTKEKPDDKESL